MRADDGAAPGAPAAARRAVLEDARRALAATDADEGCDGPVAAVRADAAARGLAAAFALGDAEAFAAIVEATRGRALATALASRAALRDARKPADLVEADLAAARRVSVAALALRRARASGRVADVRAATRALTLARAERLAAAERLDAAVGCAVHEAPPPAPTLSTVREGLGEDGALLVAAESDGSVRVLVATRDAARLVDLGPVEAVDAAIAASADAASGEGDGGAACTALAGALAPLALPPTVRRVTIVPDARFARAPLACAWPERALTWWPSMTVARLCAAPAERGDGVLAVGDPDFGPVSRGGLVRLPATRDEAVAVGDVTLLGEEATEARLWAALAPGRRWRAVHLATHAFSSGEDARTFSVALAPDERHGDDGLVSALDATRHGVCADLVVVAGDRSARTSDVAGDGPSGFVTELLRAGASGVVGSLGAADDEATRVLLTRFHTLWNPRDEDGLPAAEALRRAQAHVRGQEGWSHPRYWAGWVLWGDPD